jgi:flagellar hook-basal body complex protein FliE
MAMHISGIPAGGIEGVAPLAPRMDAPGAGTAGASFGDMLAGLASQTGATDAAVEDLAVGGERDLHDVTLAVELESMAFELALEIRNKLVDAYNEIFRMAV